MGIFIENIDFFLTLLKQGPLPCYVISLLEMWNFKYIDEKQIPVGCLNFKVIRKGSGACSVAACMLPI